MNVIFVRIITERGIWCPPPLLQNGWWPRIYLLPLPLFTFQLYNCNFCIFFFMKLNFLRIYFFCLTSFLVIIIYFPQIFYSLRYFNKTWFTHFWIIFFSIFGSRDFKGSVTLIRELFWTQFLILLICSVEKIMLIKKNKLKLVQS